MTILIHIFVAVAVFFSACGEIREPDDVPPEFDGRWGGPATVVIGSDDPRTYDGLLTVTIDGKSAMLVGLCPDGSGAIHMFGFDGVLAWEDSTPCRPSLLSGCLVSITYHKGTARVVDGLLEVAATGEAELSGTTAKCVGVTPVAFTFAGVTLDTPSSTGTPVLQQVPDQAMAP